MVYYGGEYPAGRSAARQQTEGRAASRSRSWAVTASTTRHYIELAGAAGDGDLATSVGAPTEELDSAKQFVDAYEAAGYADPYAAYGAYVLRRRQRHHRGPGQGARPSADERRRRVRPRDRQAVRRRSSFDGVTGKVAFDEYGDTTNRVLTVYKVDGGKEWKPETGRVRDLGASSPTAPWGGSRADAMARRSLLGSRPSSSGGRFGQFVQQLVNGTVLGSLLRADRPRLHDGLRHHPADQLRPRRDLHDRRVRRALTVHLGAGSSGRARPRWSLLPVVLLGGHRRAPVAVAVVMERFAYRPLRNAPRLAPLITAIGVSILPAGGGPAVLPRRQAPAGLPDADLPGTSFQIAGVTIQLARRCSWSRWRLR